MLFLRVGKSWSSFTKHSRELSFCFELFCKLICLVFCYLHWSDPAVLEDTDCAVQRANSLSMHLKQQHLRDGDILHSA